MKEITCPNCGGDGWVRGRGGSHKPCPRCGGSGKIRVEEEE